MEGGGGGRRARTRGGVLRGWREGGYGESRVMQRLCSQSCGLCCALLMTSAEQQPFPLDEER